CASHTSSRTRVIDLPYPLCPPPLFSLLLFFLLLPRTPKAILFPYTTLFRSASLPLIKERILVIILLLHFLSLMLGSVLVLMLPLLVWLTPDLRIKKSLLKCNWTIRKRLPRCKMRLK